MVLIEDLTTELKREYTPEIIKTVIAFANTNGGTIYIGIEDDGDIAGIENVSETMLKVSNAVRDSIKPDVTLFTDYQQEQIGNKTILTIAVQKGTSSPYYLTSKGIRPEGVFVRQGASSVPATETAILRMIKDTDGETYEEVRSLNQDLTFEYAEKEFSNHNISFEENQKKTLQIKNADGIYTNLGLLLSDQCIHTIKLAVYEGNEKEQFKDRREFSGSLFKQLNDVYEFIDRYNNIRSEINGLQRIDVRDYPTEAIREALLNAIVHRDYSFRDSTLVNIFDNCMEFVSIGGLVKGITLDDVKLGISVTRNHNLANIFYRLAFIEAYGTGIPKIMHSYREYETKPRIEATNNAFRIALPNTVNEKTVSNQPANKTAIQSNPVKNKKLAGDEQTVIALFDKNEFVTRQDVETALDASQAKALRVLKRLTKTGKIRTIGGGRNTKYKKTDD
ncbi:hypothetical protein MmiEs2_16480 [Methanimicrococcus stummii]|uniref:Schlafen AlbA-2 domain-containing protein n=1 Tax=Methanimicrococcus stummii TaxID=3028294 RepID=A0AA96ZXV9_9EURY|nr:RNA-binding domain-containing protein [Methanimicrococcus sp. Es2]WNY29419.1 hypothetical protein MmiEs2_16480 [Methanimicrococcus sp. Es2]